MIVICLKLEKTATVEADVKKSTDYLRTHTLCWYHGAII